MEVDIFDGSITAQWEKSVKRNNFYILFLHLHAKFGCDFYLGKLFPVSGFCGDVEH